ncbi:prepilin-type N-terminal cleavage/methylation domain-containing protein [Crenobacter cavernae]|nr:prepilin-type N-terminal cleavage/methylation domain-containing protein [Crenobacter cavernae]
MNTQRGFTLIELMVGVLISLIVTLALAKMLVSFLDDHRATEAQLRLSKSLAALNQLAVGELRRTGYAAPECRTYSASGVNAGLDYPNVASGTLASAALETVRIENGVHCVRFAYAPPPASAGSTQCERGPYFGLQSSQGQMWVFDASSSANWRCNTALTPVADNCANGWCRAHNASDLQVQLTASSTATASATTIHLTLSASQGALFNGDQAGERKLKQTVLLRNIASANVKTIQ